MCSTKENASVGCLCRCEELAPQISFNKLHSFPGLQGYVSVTGWSQGVTLMELERMSFFHFAHRGVAGGLQGGTWAQPPPASAGTLSSAGPGGEGSVAKGSSS